MTKSNQSPSAELIDVSVAYGDTPAVRDASLTLRAGEVHALLGTSGAGKTTLLRAIAGFERLSGGTLRIGGRDVDGRGWVPPEKRRVGVVFQDYALFPHLSVAKNVAFGSKGRDPNAPRVRELLEMIGLPDFGPRSPRELSGGEQQRIALARALAQDPDVLLLDEPFAHLDPSRRDELRDATLKLVRAAGVAALLVTHDAADAMVAADVIHVMSNGRIAQSGAPREVYRKPVDRQTALGLGAANFVPTTSVGEHSVQTALGDVPCESPVAGDVMLRPEWLCVGDGGVEALVEDVRFRGPHDELTLMVNGAVVQAAAGEGLRPGDTTTLRATRGWILPPG